MLFFVKYIIIAIFIVIAALLVYKRKFNIIRYDIIALVLFILLAHFIEYKVSIQKPVLDSEEVIDTTYITDNNGVYINEKYSTYEYYEFNPLEPNNVYTREIDKVSSNILYDNEGDPRIETYTGTKQWLIFKTDSFVYKIYIPEK